MSDEEKTAGENGTAAATASASAEPPSLDEHTTEPNAPEPVTREVPAAVPGKWQMPKPKFQQTSGYLPQGYLKDIQPSGPRAHAGSEDTTQEQAPFVPQPPARDAAVPDVEPQPDLTEQLIPEEPSAEIGKNEAPVKKGLRFRTVVLGLIGMVIILAAFLVTVYFVFLAKPSGGNNF